MTAIIERKLGEASARLYQRVDRLRADAELVQAEPTRAALARIVLQVRELEKFCTEERARRNDVEPERYKHPVASYFQSRSGRRVEVCDTHGDGDHGDGSGCVIKRRLVDAPPMQIDEIVAWSRTDRGGRQMPMFEQRPTGGCMRWGMCETGKADEDDR